MNSLSDIIFEIIIYINFLINFGTGKSVTFIAILMGNFHKQTWESKGEVREGREGRRGFLSEIENSSGARIMGFWNGVVRLEPPRIPPRAPARPPGQERMNSYFLISRRPVRTLHVDCLFLVEPPYNITMACFQFCFFFHGR